MKTLLLPLLMMLLLSGSRPSALIHTHTSAKVIALQPVGFFDRGQLLFVQQELSHFFKTPVIILPEIPVRRTWLNRSKGERYSADSIIACLRSETNDTIVRVVGLMSKDIYTTLRDKNGHIKSPAYKFAIWGVLGLGSCPGKSCIISNFRMRTPDDKKFRHRLRTVVIHEVGHNLGLPHCSTRGCIMSDTRGTVRTIDSCRNDYCPVCRNKLAEGN